MASSSVAPVVYVVPGSGGELAYRVARACADHPHVLVRARTHGEVQQALRAMDARGESPRAVCLLGGDDVLPHARFEDLTGNDDAVRTDNDYGMLASPTPGERGGPLGLPLVPVTRIPARDPDTLERLLATRGVLAPDWSGGLAVSAQVWEAASAAVLSRIAPGGEVRLRTSPALEADGVVTLLGPGVGRLYFNVHGSDQVTDWNGDGEGAHPVVLRPSQIRVSPHAILASEACYGARHDSPDTVALRFLAAGGSAFVGSTIIAWGPAAPPNTLADLVPLGVFTALDEGHDLGTAMLQARRAVLESAGDRLTPQLVNTLGSFVAYGSPLARVQGRAARMSSAPATRKAPPTSGVSEAAHAAGPIGDVLGRVRRGGYGPLQEARERLAHGASQAWSLRGRERVSLTMLAPRFRSAAEIQAALSQTLGEVRGDASLLRFHTGQGEETMILAEGPARHGIRTLVALVVDADGTLRERYVSRGARAR